MFRFFSSTSTTRSNSQDQPSTRTSELEQGLNSSFVDYLDRTNCRVFGLEKKISSPTKKLKSPKTTVRQMKLDKIVYPEKQNENEDSECLEKTLDTKDPEPIQRNSEFVTCEHEVVDFNVCDRQEAEVFIDEKRTAPSENLFKNKKMNSDEDDVVQDEKEALDHTVLCQDSSDSDSDISPPSPAMVSVSQRSLVSECDHTESPRELSQQYTSSQEQCSQTSRTKVKVGLSKSNCKGIGVSSFLDGKKQSQISTCLQKFKNVATNNVGIGDTSTSKSSATTTDNIEEKTSSIKRYLDEEVLPERKNAVNMMISFSFSSMPIF